MEEEKKYVAGWILWLALILTIIGVGSMILKSLGIIGQTVVERKVFEQSYQKQAADSDALQAYEANIAILQSRLSDPSLSSAQRSEIQGQINAMRILQSTKRN